MAFLRPFVVSFLLRRSFWGAKLVLILIGSKIMTQKANISVFFLWFCQKKSNLCSVFCVFVIWVITFKPIQTCSAPQNDRLNLSLVKDTYVVGKKWLEMFVRVPFVILLFMHQSLLSFYSSYRLSFLSS